MAQKKIIEDKTIQERLNFIDKNESKISLSRQAELLSISRSSVYYKRIKISSDDIALMELIDRVHLSIPYYGKRKIKHELFNKYGKIVNLKKLQKLLAIMGITNLMPYKKTTVSNKAHKKYPYLLRNLKIIRINQVWVTDISYLPTKNGFMYLTAILDVFSRKILAYRVSNSMDTDFCIEALMEALEKYGNPEIFNSDQGVQFTSEQFTSILLTRQIKISMDSVGRALDNIYIERFWRSYKYEDLYFCEYLTVPELKVGLHKYIIFYNSKRIHESLEYRTPDYYYFNLKKL